MQPIRDKEESKGNRIYSIISPVSLVAIVMLNFLLIYLNLVNLQNQTAILEQIQENTEIALVNQQIGLNASQHNEDMLNRIILVQEIVNHTLHGLNFSDTE
jgi:hypothetical protein